MEAAAGRLQLLGEGAGGLKGRASSLQRVERAQSSSCTLMHGLTQACGLPGGGACVLGPSTRVHQADYTRPDHTVSITRGSPHRLNLTGQNLCTSSDLGSWGGGGTGQGHAAPALLGLLKQAGQAGLGYQGWQGLLVRSCVRACTPGWVHLCVRLLAMCQLGIRIAARQGWPHTGGQPPAGLVKAGGVLGERGVQCCHMTKMMLGRGEGWAERVWPREEEAGMLGHEVSGLPLIPQADGSYEMQYYDRWTPGDES